MSEIEKKALEENEAALADEALDDAAGGALSKQGFYELYEDNPYYAKDEPHVWKPDDPRLKDPDNGKNDPYYYHKV